MAEWSRLPHQVKLPESRAVGVMGSQVTPVRVSSMSTFEFRISNSPSPLPIASTVANPTLGGFRTLVPDHRNRNVVEPGLEELLLFFRFCFAKKWDLEPLPEARHLCLFFTFLISVDDPYSSVMKCW